MSKTIFITGSTDGIGKLAAAKLARDGHSIILHGRNPGKLRDTISELKANSQNDLVTGYVADFANLEIVKMFADEILQQHSNVDVLINNAGVFNSPHSKTATGIDIRFSVNYLAPFILTSKLIPLLEKSNSGRIVNLSSAAQSPVSMNALVGDKELSAQEAYSQSKLALTMWSFYLAEKHKNIQVIPVNPGSLLNTKMVQEAYGQYWSSADKGANILYDLAVSAKYSGKSGEYFDNDKGGFGPAHSDANNLSKIDQLISTTESLFSK